MIAEILVQTIACKEMLVEIYAKQEGLEHAEVLSKIEKRIDQCRKQIDEKLDADYGDIDVEVLHKKPNKPLDAT